MASRRDSHDPLDPPRERATEAHEWGSKARKDEARATRRRRAALVREAKGQASIDYDHICGPDCGAPNEDSDHEETK